MDDYVKKLETALAETCRALIEQSQKAEQQKQELTALLRDKLSIKIRITEEIGWQSTHQFVVELYLDEEMISQDYDYISIRTE